MAFNPYRPGAGEKPSYLAGRDADIAYVQDILDSIKIGYPARSVIYYGLRGVGKTVLLGQIRQMCRQMHIPCERIEIGERNFNFSQSLALAIYKLTCQLSTIESLKNKFRHALSIIKAFSIKYGDIDVSIDVEPLTGISDTGILSNDLTELFLALGEIAQNKESGVVMLIDEIQYIRDKDFDAFMRALHMCNQDGYPIVVFAAGLPKILKIAGDIKSYAERLFDFYEIGALDKEASILALQNPVKRFHTSYTDEALDYVVQITHGYPYFLQEYGKWIWLEKGNSTIIDLSIVKKAYKNFIDKLDSSFFKTRHDRATAKEIQFMLAMAKTDKLPCTMQQIAKIMKAKSSTISPIRAQLIHKGFIYSIKRGEIDFTVPQFAQYLKRHYIE